MSRPPASQPPVSQPQPAQLPAEVYARIGAFRLAMRRFLAFSDAGARAQGLTPQQHQALLAIKSHGADTPISISELADQLMIRTHSAVGLVARLVERNLVVRHPSPQDRRRVLLELRAQGEAALETITRANLEQLDDLAEILSGLLAAARTIERDGR